MTTNHMSACTYSYSTHDDIHEYTFYAGDYAALMMWERLLPASTRVSRRPIRMVIKLDTHTDILPDLIACLKMWRTRIGRRTPLFVVVLHDPRLSPCTGMKNPYVTPMEQVCFSSNVRYNEAIQWLKDSSYESLEAQISAKSTFHPAQCGATRPYADVG